MKKMVGIMSALLIIGSIAGCKSMCCGSCKHDHDKAECCGTDGACCKPAEAEAAAAE